MHFNIIPNFTEHHQLRSHMHPTGENRKMESGRSHMWKGGRGQARVQYWDLTPGGNWAQWPRKDMMFCLARLKATGQYVHEHELFILQELICLLFRLYTPLY